MSVTSCLRAGRQGRRKEIVGHLNARVLQFSNYTFDFSVWDWGATLTAGGTLCLVRKQKLMDDIAAVNRDMDVTFIETTPTVLSLIRPESVPSVTIAVMGGEVLTPEVRDAWADAVSLRNVYGPTETATAVTALKHITASTQCTKIGHPFGLNHLYILDESLRPVPLGCVGELRLAGIMPSTLVTGAWSIVLAAHANCSDVHIRTGSCRVEAAPIRGIESMTGVTLNTVAPSRNPPPRDELYNQTRLHSASTKTSRQRTWMLRGIPVSGLFKSILNFRNAGYCNSYTRRSPRKTPTLTNLRHGSRDGLDYPFALTVDVVSGDSLLVGAAYIQEIISEAEVHALLDHFEAALLFLIHHPKSSVGDVELITQNELQRLIPIFNTEKLLNPAQNISQLIEMQVRRTPQRIALQFDQEEFLTYAEMDGLANDLAQKLLDNDVQHGTLVALYMDKSIEMFLSILAVHKAGGAYVPLDIDHPAERIQTILRLAQPTMVLTTREFRNRLASTILGSTVTAVSVDFRDLSPAAKPEVGHVGRDDVCHVLFTSVILTHGSIIESAIGSQEVLGPLNGRVLQFSNYTFDVSVWDWSATLIAGGTLCIARKQRLIDDLGGVSRELDVTFIETTPTVLSLIHPEQVPSLQMLAVGGEVLTPNARDSWADTVSFINVYGPTEASTNVLALRDVTSSTECSKIGHAFGLNSVYNLDERLRPVPLGCVGELFISGPQVASGYLQNPEETAKAFVTDPFRPGSTMYATGDLVRMNPGDGSLSFVDRRDTQIKIRGLRVETGEIEAVLKATSTAITNAVVLKLDVGHETLVAFLEYGSQVSEVNTDVLTIVNDKGFGELVASLRYAIRQKLPSYMAPTIYVTLNRFPVTSTGKLDRKALNAYFHRHQQTLMEMAANHNDSYHNVDTALLTEMQLAVRSLWASILGISEGPLRIDDDFYTMGGDSMSAIRLASAARKAGLHLPATDIIRNPTIRAMAQIANSAVVDHEFDDDEAPSVTLNEMGPEHLTMLSMNEAQLDFLRLKLLPDHGLFPKIAHLGSDGFSSSDVLDVYPTTGLQTSLLMAGLIVQDAYIVRQAWNLPLGTHSDSLREAFKDFIDHPNGMMFRTVFAFDPTSNRWLQVLMRPGARQMEWTTVAVADETELELRVADYEGGRAIQPFEKGELPARACVFELDGSARVLVWCMHHALLDHWALDNAILDLENAYVHRPLVPRRSFKAMIKYLERLDRTPGLDFWRTHLANVAPTPFLQALPGASRATTNATVGRGFRTGHGSFTRESGIMPSTLVTAAWSLVLAAHSNCIDVVFGQVLAGRNAPIKDIWSMTGITMNTVPRRVIRRPEITVLDMLRQIQSDQIEISKHENITLRDLQSEGIAPSGLFKSILNFRNFPDTELVYPKVANKDPILTNLRHGSRDGLDYPFALTVDVVSGDSLLVGAAYIQEIISEAEVHALLDHFEAALLFLIHHPKSSVGDVELITQNELQRLIPIFNTEKLLNPAQNISQLIEMQVRRTPQRIALQFDQEEFLTYAEMDGLANDLAQKLLDNDVQHGTLVALYMDKSIEMFLSILAVHKAGGAYVPLDIDHPAERIQTILRLAQPTMVLTTREFRNRLASTVLDSTVTAVSVDFRDLSPAAKPEIGHVGRDDVCHVLFTSGSTGTPKGVILTHGSIIESAVGSQEVTGPLNGRVLQFSNYTFDVSVWDWSATLSAGGTLCIVRKQKLIEDLGAVSRDMDVTFIESTPTVLSLIHPEEVPSLQMLVVGGELLTPEVRDTWADAVSLINGYGQTETSTNVIVLKGITSSTECSKIGYRFGLNTAYILDERLRPVPLGCVGELFIGGPQVSSGYLHNPEETAKAFVADPIRPGSTMYATGDLVRLNAVDGSLLFVDRRDTQIKIRGLRVETGEIEAVLKATSKIISNAIVVKLEGDQGETLIAFLECSLDTHSAAIVVVQDDSINPLLVSLKHAVRQKLPSYMAPATYVILNRFPLMSSGKLDRNTLIAFFHTHEREIRASECQLQRHVLAGARAVKRTRAQTRIMKLWQTVLGIQEDIAIDDPFSIMGGDSIKIMRLSGLAFKHGIPLSIAEQLKRQTIRAQAQLLSRK
ncbi:acetyl-CoA synthetase-like protein [Ramaria rubella]|nr:acetyl-CoA synthetase-like protein [Ramaria rubella]